MLNVVMLNVVAPTKLLINYGRIHNIAFSSQFMNGLNKLECLSPTILTRHA